MLQQVRPIGVLIVQITLAVRVSERTHTQIEIILIGRAKLKAAAPLRRPLRLRPARLEIGVETKVGRQIEGTIVIGVVAIANIPHRRLRRGRLQCRMGIDHPVSRIESIIGNALDARFPIVDRYILDQPVDRVVRIGRVIGIGRTLVRRLMRRHVNKRPFGKVAPAHILIHEDEALFLEGFRLQR